MHSHHNTPLRLACRSKPISSHKARSISHITQKPHKLRPHTSACGIKQQHIAQFTTTTTITTTDPTHTTPEEPPTLHSKSFLNGRSNKKPRANPFLAPNFIKTNKSDDVTFDPHFHITAAGGAQAPGLNGGDSESTFDNTDANQWKCPRVLNEEEKSNLLTEKKRGARTSNKTFRFEKVRQFHNVLQPNVFQLLRLGSHPLRGAWKEEYFHNDLPLVLELGCGEGFYAVGLAENDRRDVVKRYNITQSQAQTQQQQEEQAKKDENFKKQLPFLNTKNYIGIDKKGHRLYTGARHALQNDFLNVAFIKTTFNLLPLFFGKHEVHEIWLTFPDLNYVHNDNRHILSPSYQTVYNHILHPNGVIHLKTDQDEIFEYAMQQIEKAGHIVIEKYSDLYAQHLYPNTGVHPLQSGLLNRTGDFEEMITVAAIEEEEKKKNENNNNNNNNVDNEKTPKEVLAIQTAYEKIWSERGKTIKYIKFRLNPHYDFVAAERAAAAEHQQQ